MKEKTRMDCPHCDYWTESTQARTNLRHHLSVAHRGHPAAKLTDRRTKAGRVAGVIEAAAWIAEHPYADPAQALSGDEPLEVGRKIAKAIREMAS